MPRWRAHDPDSRELRSVPRSGASHAVSPRLHCQTYRDFCTVLLDYLVPTEAALVFKGGTCLSKVHTDFYRLSEDLDFVIPMAVDAPRSQRSRQMAGLKEALAALPKRLPVFRLLAPLTGANSSTQYIATLGYTSLLGGQDETIKIEVGLREPLLTPPFAGKAQTILIDPISARPLVKPLALNCISRMEAFAEKFRAALSRREAAIRDFYDLDYAVRRLSLRPADAGLVALIRQKLAMPGNGPVDVSTERLEALRQQVEPQLQAVLRPGDFAGFNLDRAFRIVSDMAAKVAK